MGDARIDGGAVRRLRQAAGLSLTELSVRAGVGRNTIIGLESSGEAKHGSTLRTLGRLAGALGVEPAALLSPTCSGDPVGAQPTYTGEVAK